MIEKIEKYFEEYFKRLIELLYSPRLAFTNIFKDKSIYISRALVFASVSILLSLGLLLVSSHSYILNIDINWVNLIKNTSVIPLQLAIIVPILSIFLHTVAKCFKGKGRIQDSAVLILYSYVLAPYATVLLIIFLTIEKILGYPVNLNPPVNPTLRIIEYICEAALLIYGSYIFCRGVQIGYKVTIRRAFMTVFTLALITVLIGYLLTVLAYKFFIR